MTDALERELVSLFTADADTAPLGVPLAAGAMRRARRRRTTRILTAAALVSATVAAVAVSTEATDRDRDPGRAAPAPSVTSNQTPPTQGAPSRPAYVSGPLPIPDAASCIIYTPANVARIPAVAFDGIIVELGPLVPQVTNRKAFSKVTTLRVNEWFHGGSGATVTVEIPTGDSIDPGPPAFALGTRLLVSGSPAWRRSKNFTAWGCGYTRYYDITTAGEWRKAHG